VVFLIGVGGIVWQEAEPFAAEPGAPSDRVGRVMTRTLLGGMLNGVKTFPGDTHANH
jgi:hypothetical protein